MTSASWPETSPEGVAASDLGYSVSGSADALRHVMGHFASGVTIATALHHGIKHAMTATAVCSVSLEPPLVLVCVSKSSRFHGAISKAKNWCLSLLTVDQEALARHFANRGRDLLSQFDRRTAHPQPSQRDAAHRWRAGLAGVHNLWHARWR